MNIPTVEITVPYYTERRYGPNSWVKKYEDIEEVSLEYAAFLNDINELDVESYVSEVHEKLANTAWGEQFHENLCALLKEELAEEMMVYYIRRKLDIATQANDKTWEDFV